MADDILLNKAQSIERCLARVLDEYQGHESELASNQTRQDALILNLLRACEKVIDLAMHLVRVERLGVPQSSRHAFDLLAEADILDEALATKMKRMVGFRNVAVHNYRVLDLDVIHNIVEKNLDDFRRFTATLLQRAPN